MNFHHKDEALDGGGKGESYGIIVQVLRRTMVVTT